MEHIVFLIIVILFAVLSLGPIVIDLFKENKVQLKYDGLLPFVIGIAWSFLAFDACENGKWLNMVFISVLGLNILYRVILKPFPTK